MSHNAHSVPNPASFTIPSKVSDPDGLLSLATKTVIDAMIETDAKKLQIGVVIVKSLQEGLDIGTFARNIVDLWGIGNMNRQDGVLYALSFLQRKQHLFACRGVVNDLGEPARNAILVGLRAHLQSGDVDAAVVKAVRSIIIEVKACRRQRKVMNMILLLLMLAGAVVVFVWARRRRRMRERAKVYDRRRAQLQQAWRRVDERDVSSQINAPCCVCIEPLLEQEPRPYANELKVEDFSILDDSEGSGAVFEGVEIFRCGHLLHRSCACRALQARNACPLCRLKDPRIYGLAAASVASAVTAANLHTFDMESWRNAVDFLFEDVIVERRQEQERQELAERRAAEAPERSFSGGGDGWWGGGDSGGGAGTSDDW